MQLTGSLDLLTAFAEDRIVGQLPKRRFETRQRQLPSRIVEKNEPGQEWSLPEAVVGEEEEEEE